MLSQSRLREWENADSLVGGFTQLRKPIRDNPKIFLKSKKIFSKSKKYFKLPFFPFKSFLNSLSNLEIYYKSSKKNTSSENRREIQEIMKNILSRAVFMHQRSQGVRGFRLCRHLPTQNTFCSHCWTLERCAQDGVLCSSADERFAFEHYFERDFHYHSVDHCTLSGGIPWDFYQLEDIEERAKANK